MTVICSALWKSWRSIEVGAVPEVVAIGEEGTVLSADEDKDIEGRAALALGAFTIVLVVLVLVL